MDSTKKHSVKKIQTEILKIFIILAVVTTTLTAAVSIVVNTRSAIRSIDENIENIACMLAGSETVREEMKAGTASGADSSTRLYLNSLSGSLSNIDVLSVTGADGIRLYHSEESLIGSSFEGDLPDFENDSLYVTSGDGPSGHSRRAFAAVYDEDGSYLGFVMAVMLTKNVNAMILRTVIIHLACAAVIIAFAVFLSSGISRRIRRMLMGYEPDVFTAMFRVRDSILESLEEGIVAVDTDGKIIYMNRASSEMLGVRMSSGRDSSADEIKENEDVSGREVPYGTKLEDVCPCISSDRVLSGGEHIVEMSFRTPQGADILAGRMPVTEDCSVTGAVCILHDRTEYTRMMEDLSGVRYIVEGMRANSHDFINKLHVILGMIKMGQYDEAAEYITHVTSIQQNVINHIVKHIDDPSVAALLIGKYTRCAEQNIMFSLKNDSRMSRNDISLPSSDLVTIIGNLTDNAVDALADKEDSPRELTVGIFTTPGAMLISVDDTGPGIPEEDPAVIFDDGFSTKGEGRGTGLYVTSQLVRRYGGEITVESEPGSGTSFTVTLTQEDR